MSLSLINKLYHGCLFIQDGKNYLVESFYEIDDVNQTCKAYLVNAECDFEIYSGTIPDFISKVVK